MCRTTSKKAKALVQPVSVEDEVFAIGPIAEGLPDAQKNASADSKAFHVGAIDGPGACWRQSLSTNGRTVQYKLDTGAQVNILPYEVYQRFSPRPRLHKASTSLFAYGAVHPIPVKGQCICEVVLPHGGSRQLRFYVLEAGVRAVPLLGLQACDQLSLVKKVEAMTAATRDDLPTTIREDEIARDYLDLFDGVGVMKESSYEIRLLDGAQRTLFPGDGTTCSLSYV